MLTSLLRLSLIRMLRRAGRPLGLLSGALLLGGAATSVQAQTVYALNRATSTLATTTISSLALGGTPVIQPIMGVTAGQVLVGLDSRPATGGLFALGYNGTGTAQLYTISQNTGTATATATAVGGAVTLALGASTEGIGFDFNPTVDRIRITSATNQANYRLNPNTGAQVDGNAALAGLQADDNLNFPISSPFAGQMPAVGSVAYTNSFIGATATMLYDIDESRSTLFVQSPPNKGGLVSPLTIINSSVNLLTTGDQTDFDVYTDPATRVSTTLLARTRAFTTSFYTLNLATGNASLITAGTLGDFRRHRRRHQPDGTRCQWAAYLRRDNDQQPDFL